MAHFRAVEKVPARRFYRKREPSLDVMDRTVLDIASWQWAPSPRQAMQRFAKTWVDLHVRTGIAWNPQESREVQ